MSQLDSKYRHNTQNVAMCSRAVAMPQMFGRYKRERFLILAPASTTAYDAPNYSFFYETHK
jgi:hypothetical protein